MNIEFKQTQNEKYPTLKINQILCHSSVSPFTDAKHLIQSHIKNDAERTNFIILGQGLGYVTKELQKILTDRKKSSYSIVVIEPDPNIFSVFQQMPFFDSLWNDINIHFYVESDIDKIFQKSFFKKTLLSRPSIIAVRPIFDIYNSYYRNFFKFRYPHNNSIDENPYLSLDFAQLSQYKKEQFNQFFDTLVTEVLHDNK